MVELPPFSMIETHVQLYRTIFSSQALHSNGEDTLAIQLAHISQDACTMHSLKSILPSINLGMTSDNLGTPKSTFHNPINSKDSL